MSVLLLLVGCYTVDSYRDDLDAAVCAWKATCYDQDEAACLTAAEAARRDADPTCEYQSAKARECVDGMKKLECPNFDTGGSFDTGDEEEEAFGFPSACDQVWECP